MAGLGAVFAVGALGGVGDALVEQARQKREDALAELKRQQQLEDYQMRREDGLADYQMQRRDSLADEQRGIQREEDRINRTAEAYRASKFSGDQAEFVSAIMPHAERVGREIGVAPEIIIAQAALESGWGRSAPGNNFFGIKSHGKSGGQTLATNEVINGQTVRINDSFRQYEDIGQSVEDYGRFLRENPRYREMLQAGDIDAQIEALGRSGYATDPQYAAKVRQIANTVRQMDPQIWRALADPATPAAVRDDIRQNVGLGGVSSDLTGETWVRQGDQEVLMGRSGGRMVPYQGPDGQPITRPAGSDFKGLDNGSINQVQDFYKDDIDSGSFGLRQPTQAQMVAEVERNMRNNPGMSLADAYTMARNAWQTQEVTTETEVPRAALSPMRLLGEDTRTETSVTTEGGFNYGNSGAPQSTPSAPRDPAAPMLPPGMTEERVLSDARDAIARGASRDDVIRRLEELGIDASAL